MWIHSATPLATWFARFLDPPFPQHTNWSITQTNSWQTWANLVFNMPPTSTYKYKKGSVRANEFLLSSATFWGSTVQQSNGLSFHLYPVSTGQNLHLREPLPNGIAINIFFPQKTSPRTLPKESHNPIACCLKDLRPVGLNEIVKIVFGESLKKGICKNNCWEIRMP